MPGERPQGGEGDAGVAAGHLHDGLAGHKRAGLLGAGHDAGGHTVLDAAGEIEALQLGIHRAGAVVQPVVDADERGVAGKSFVSFHNGSPFVFVVWRRAKQKGCVPAHTALQKGPANKSAKPGGLALLFRRGRG